MQREGSCHQDLPLHLAILQVEQGKCRTQPAIKLFERGAYGAHRFSRITRNAKQNGIVFEVFKASRQINKGGIEARDVCAAYVASHTDDVECRPFPLRPAGEHLDLFSDRKSTRLNSSHSSISYAVFCLKKKYNDD